jgi:hypothetical protein
MSLSPQIEPARVLRGRDELAAVQPSLGEYAIVSTALGGVGIALYFIAQGSQASVDPAALLGPMFALTALIALVGLSTALVRNYAILRNLAQGAYYREYDGAHAPPDWVERPARTFNNLMQAPLLF